MSQFNLVSEQVHSLIKLMGVAFHSMNNKTHPPSVNFSYQELEKMFTLHENLIAYMSHLESVAADKYHEEEQFYPQF